MRSTYNYRERQVKPKRRWPIKLALALVLLAGLGLLAYKLFGPTPVEQAVASLNFNQTVTAGEQQIIKDAVTAQEKTFSDSLDVSVTTSLEAGDSAHLMNVYLPVTNVYAVRQSVSSQELARLTLYVHPETDAVVRTALAEAVGVDESKLTDLNGEPADIADDAVLFMPVNRLSSAVKLLALNDAYYLDSFNKGGVFRQAVFEGSAKAEADDLQLNDPAGTDDVLTVNSTGVTALTRMMMRKLSSVSGPEYFSAKIGEFLAAADITHVSNEVSFKENCQWSAALFCSPPEFIETLKASGVDLVELTGNHNNDVGSDYNTQTIELYHSLGWQTVGGGLNNEEAAKPASFDQKGTKLIFLGYNYPDSPNGRAISGPTSAGANKWDIDQIKSDIETAKQQADFVFVHIQFWECYAYPEGYLEFPECDGPIPNQEPVFKQVADLGADMVVGSSAHQPQTYEVYNGTPIYYGLGNLYFDQDRWPGTERGIILTHYFKEGQLLQTKLTPTVYDSDYQTRKMTAEESAYLLNRLKQAR